MTFPGPSVLGRGVVVLPGRALPVPFDGWPRLRVELDTDPGELHEAWLRRQPVVVELACDTDALRTKQTDQREPWQVPLHVEFARERLQFLVWANNWDWRTDEPIWWWARTKAAKLGAVEGGPADVVLPGGMPAWIDGGPRHPLSLSSGEAVVHRDSVDLGRLTAARFSPPSVSLAPDQLAAVAHDVGPARVIAPAGSGKTRVLTARLRHLLADRGWESEAVAAFAYNKRAVDEMAERTADVSAQIRTLNSLGLRLVGSRRTIEEVDVRRLLESLVELPRAVNTDPYLPYLEGLRMIRLGLVNPAVAERETGAEGLAELFPRFRALLADRGLIDFDGQLYEALARVLVDPRLRAGNRHLLVDEFQDLTPVHLVLLRLLAAPAYDVFGVGDDDQVIYGFSRASPEFLLQYDRYFPGASHYALEVNYRCPPAVIDAARSLLSYNERRIPKTIHAAPERPAVVDEFVVRRVAAVDEAAALADVVEGWHKDGRGYADMAALARVNSALLPVQVVFTERGIPGRRPIDQSILGRTGIRTALAYLRIGADPGRIAAADVTETIRRPSRRIARNVVEMLTRRGSTSVSDIRRLASRLSGGDGSKLAVYEADLQRVVQAVSSGDAADALRVVRVELGLGGTMDTLDSARREADRSTHADDLLALEQVAALHRNPATFEAWLREVLTRRGPPEPGVELSTIHRVKGREWDDVVVFGVADETLPHRLASDEDEERRLLHVAITRGRSRVVVLADEDNPSPFVGELDGSRPRGERKRRPVRVAAAETAAAAESAKPVGPSGSAGMRVVEALKTWRKETAARDKVPAYIVLSDADIDGIAVRRPRSLAEMADCRGIGPVKLERYGDELLAVVDTALDPAAPPAPP
jgi:DNA helicase-2/ATP-dependent DNA helicase PcrA